MKTPKCYTWLESCGSHLSGSVKKNIYFCILQRVRFSRTLRTDIFLYTEKLSKAMRLWMVIDHWSIQRKRQHWSVKFAMHTKPWRRPTSIMVCTANWTKLLGLSTAEVQVDPDPKPFLHFQLGTRWLKSVSEEKSISTKKGSNFSNLPELICAQLEDTQLEPFLHF